MTLAGHVENGVVVIDGPDCLPEGVRVWIELAPPNASAPRDHAAFLNSYAPEDEGLYDDDSAG
jgi:hypothetical protein